MVKLQLKIFQIANYVQLGIIKQPSKLRVVINESLERSRYYCIKSDEHK